MPEFQTTRRVNVSAETAYDVAANVSLYPRFLPLLKEAKIIGTPEFDNGITKFKARLGVSYEKLNINESFVSHVTCDPRKLMVVSESNEAPFKMMRTVWTITPVGQHADVSIHINYSMKSMLVQFAVAAAMGVATQKVMAFFEQRALEVQRQSVTS